MERPGALAPPSAALRLSSDELSLPRFELLLPRFDLGPRPAVLVASGCCSLLLCCSRGFLLLLVLLCLELSWRFGGYLGVDGGGPSRLFLDTGPPDAEEGDID